MKKYLFLMILFFFVLLFGCNRLPEGYECYQTFDEYNLKGVSPKETIRKPYVAIKKDKDTLFVLICKGVNNKRLAKYIDYRRYWYCFEYIKNKYKSNYECDTIPLYVKKYIFNDTIVQYSYYLQNNKIKINEIIKIKTHKNLICLSSSIGFHIEKDNIFNQLRKLLSNYKESFSPYEPSIFQPKYFKSYKTVIVDDKLILYENYGNKIEKKGDIVEIIKLNSLGEFTAPW